MGTRGELYFPINSEITDPSRGTVYVLKKIIGRGAYAQCFLTVTSETHFAMKIVRLSELKSEKVRQKLESEISIHSMLSHPNIVKMYASFRSDEYIFMVLELCERGALDDLLRRNEKLKERYVAKFMTQIIKGLVYLHDTMSVVHRDLKLGNLFLDGHLNVKIGDFGLSAIITGNEKRRTVCGTPNYIAPEVLFGKATGHSFEADIWSLGVILYTLLIGTPPFQQKKVEEIYKLIEKNQYIFPPNNTLSSEAIDLITRLLTTNPNDRPDLSQIAHHRFLTQRENLAHRVYRNLTMRRYSVEPITHEHVVFSIPINSIAGVGYILKSGIYGVYYHNMINTFLKGDVMVFIKLSVENDRKVFMTEEHLVSNIPSSLKQIYSNLLHFIKNYSLFGAKSCVLKENSVNTQKGGLNSTYGACQFVFVAKLKRIKDGLLFIMTNNVFVFDFNDGAHVVIAADGAQVYAFDDDRSIEFSDKLKNACTEVLKLYVNVR
ncbi:polo-like kinase 1 [Pancytospora epiphaga]|nr:polo-like kinase 1 [Pancytospora epiphaga]